MTAAKLILHSPKQVGAPQLQLLTPLADGPSAIALAV